MACSGQEGDHRLLLSPPKMLPLFTACVLTQANRLLYKNLTLRKTHVSTHLLKPYASTSQSLKTVVLKTKQKHRSGSAG